MKRIASLLTGMFVAAAPAAGAGTAAERFTAEAAALRPLVQTPAAQAFLDSAGRLPERAPRTLLQEPGTGAFHSESDARQMAESGRASTMKPVTIDGLRYYTTRYGSPLAYVRVFELAGRHGMVDLRGLKVLDFGYGTVGHLRMLADQGAHAVGVDVDPFLRALYSDPGDSGTVASGGSVMLLHGRYPADAAVAGAIGSGYDLVVSKNTLKRGYLRPAPPADARLLIDLGVPEGVFLKTLHDALRPGGLLVIYNLMPAQAPPERPFIPAADGHSPFTGAEFEAAGFQVLAIDVNDDAFARAMGRALGWDRNAEGIVNPRYDESLFALYTIVQRRR